MIQKCALRELMDFPGTILHENEIYASIHKCNGKGRFMCPYDGRLSSGSCIDFKEVENHG